MSGIKMIQKEDGAISFVVKNVKVNMAVANKPLERTGDNTTTILNETQSRTSTSAYANNGTANVPAPQTDIEIPSKITAFRVLR